MTDIDTSPEAVERLAQRLEEEGWRRAPALLRQLAKERGEARNAALEEAKNVVWEKKDWHGYDLAAEIDALKTPQTGVDRNAKAIGLAIDFTTGIAREVKE